MNYSSLKENYDLKNCEKKDAKIFINKGVGSATLLEEIIQSNPNSGGFKTISEISDLWRKNVQGSTY